MLYAQWSGGLYGHGIRGTGFAWPMELHRQGRRYKGFLNTTALLYFALISFSRMGGGAVSPLVVTDNIGGAFRCGAL